MKIKIILAAIVLAAISFTACSSLTGTTNGTTPSNGISTTSTAYLNGKTFGTSFTSLYSAYKAAGKVDLTNASNLLNMAQLASAVSAIKGNAKNTTFYKEFSAGAIASSGIINTANVDNLITTISGLNLSSFINTGNNGSSTTTNNAATAATTAATLASLFSSIQQ